jgi:hypothetical protein
MQLTETLVWIRGCERLLTLAGAFLLIVFGIFLFKWGVSGAASLVAKSGTMSVQLLNASPGIVCFLFGTVLLIFNLSGKLTVTTEGPQPNVVTNVKIGDESVLRKIEYSGGTQPSVSEEIVRIVRESSPEELAKPGVIKRLKELAGKTK